MTASAPLSATSPADPVAVVGGVGHHHVGRQTFDQRQGLRGVASMAAGQNDADRAAETSDGEVVLKPPRERPSA
jgi:hypothetical protein